MTTPCILCVAITGSLPTKADNPAVPITITEQIESTHEAFEAGASIVHAHVRDDEGKPTSDPERFAQYDAQVRAEYAWVPWPIYGIKRKQVLQGFLQSKALYATPYFHARIEQQARAKQNGGEAKRARRAAR